MKLSALLSRREALLRQAHLANLAFAYTKLVEFAARVTRAGLRGEVRLRQAAPDAERYGASLTTLEGRQSIIEEHFTDEHVAELADVLEFLTGERDLELTFRIEEMSDKFLRPVRSELERMGVRLDRDAEPMRGLGKKDSRGRSRVDGTV